MTPESITPLERQKPNLLLISFSSIQFNVLTILLLRVKVKKFIIFCINEHRKPHWCEIDCMIFRGDINGVVGF